MGQRRSSSNVDKKPSEDGTAYVVLGLPGRERQVVIELEKYAVCTM
jgi:hypothetical protein